MRNVVATYERRCRIVHPAVLERERLARRARRWAWLRRLRRFARSWACVWLFGGHELYRAHSDTKLFHACLLCGHETEGWTIDRMDWRRLRLTTDGRQ